MGTALLQQLQKLAVPQASVVVDEKKKASILFDPKEAASFDRETFYELGLIGLEELKKLNMRFEQFEDTLFDLSSRDLQRAIQSAEINKKLDREITKFLTYVSPYFLLKCAHQALEWLIQRFQIHKYNVDDLMMLILPYHETNIFVRVLQIIKIKEPTNRWHWLHRLQNAGVPLSKTALLNHCSSNTAFLSFVCHIPTTALKLCNDSCSGLHIMCTFSCMTIVGALEHSKEVSEVQVSHILKLLVETLTSPFLEFSCMSIVITAELARTIKISEQVLLVLVNKLSKVPHASLESQCCTVLSLLYRGQRETLSRIPDKALIHFAKSKTFITSLQKIVDGGGDVFDFVATLIREASNKILQHNENRDDLQNFLEALLSSVTLEEQDAETIVLIIIDSYILRKRNGDNVDDDDDDDDGGDDTMDVDDSSDDATAQSVLQWYSSFLRSLERQYSTVFDTVVKKVLENTKDERKRRSLLDILGFMPKVNFQISGIDMFEKLHHPSVSMRVEGIKYLLASVNKVQADDKEFVQNILRNRLQEDSYKVVQAVLECPASDLSSLVGEEFFVMQMIKISAKYWHMTQISDTLKCKIVAYLCSDVSFQTKQNAVFFAVLPYLLPKSDEDVPFAICALESEFASKHKVMSVIRKEIPNFATVTDADSVCSVVSKLITNKKYVPNTTDLLGMINEVPIFKTDPVYKFIGTVLMTASITKATTVDVKWKAMDTILEYFTSPNMNDEVKSSPLLSGKTMCACMQVAFTRKLPIQGLLFCLQTLTKNIELPEDVTRRHWWDIASMEDDFQKNSSLFFIKLFEVLIVGCMVEGNAAEHVRKAYICNLKNLFKNVFPNLQLQLGFLSNLWVSHEFGPKHKGIASYELQLRSLLLARSLLLKTEECVGWTMKMTSESIIPPLLIALSCPMAPVRVAAVECFGALGNTFGAALNQEGYHCLLANLLQFEEELKLDSEQISVVLYKLLSPDTAVQSCFSSSQRSQLNVITSSLFDCVVQNETPLHFKAALLKLLSHVNSSNIMRKLAPVAREVLSVAVSSGSQLDFYRSAVLRNIFSRFENDTYSSLAKYKEVWNLFKSALFDYRSLVYEENSRITCPSIIAMNQISKDLFDALPNQQQELLGVLVSVATEADSPDVVSVVGHVFKKIVLECKHVVLELEKVRDAQCAPDPLAVKRRTRSQSNAIRPSLELLKTKEWREGTTLLELIQNKKKLRGVHLLFPVLFDLLKRCLDFEEQAPVEYIKQLILSCLLHCCQKLSSEAEDDIELSEKEINVELVVQCIRASQNPQTHHHALLVLSQLAGMIPEQVLHNIMAIFTFMGSSILRQDDAYSFQIISKVVDTVIPILVKANDAGVDPRKLFDPVAGVLRVFVDALVDIPEHRQMPLFQKLMVTLGGENFLWLLMALVIESHVRQRTAPDQNKDGMLPKKLNFVVNVTLKFDPLIAIKNSIRLMEYLQTLPMEKDQKDDKVSGQKIGMVTKLFDVSNCSKSEFHHFKYAIVIFLSGMMGNPNFINQVAALPADDVKDLEQYYAHLIECVLQHIQTSVHASEINVGKPTAKFWKCMLGQSYDLLDKVNALLLSDMFLHVILSLLNNPIHTVRRRAMELMNARLQNEEFFMSCKTEDLLSLVKPLLNIINTISEENISFDEQLNQQTALASMKLMARLMAAKHTDIFGEILDNLTNLIKKKTLQGNVLASALLCGAELCSCLRAFAVSNLPKFMPALLKVFKKEKKTENPDVVLLAIVTAVHKVVESLPHFLSPYLEQLLLEVSISSSRFLQEEETQKIAPIVAKLDLVRQKLASEVPLRVLMPVVNTAHFRLLKKKHYGALGPLMGILASSFADVSSADFNYLRTELSNFFMAALQFRSENDEEETGLEVVDAVEGHVIKALVALVLKLSESSFRPLYYNLFHWATALDVHKERLITFYRVSHSIAECLKGLFVLFAGHFIKNAASLLDQTNLCKSNPLVYGKSHSGKAKSLLLLDAVLKTLHSIFLYDSAQFLNKERFDTLMQPLVDQLENTLGGLDAYKERASSLLTPCIVQFAVVTADDSLWKQLNYQILLKTRNSVPMVRLMAVQTVCGIAQKLGDDFLSQLPETVPFLAELMEDEEEEVEQACVKVVQEMEEILGEPLKKYF